MVQADVRRQEAAMRRWRSGLCFAQNRWAIDFFGLLFWLTSTALSIRLVTRMAAPFRMTVIGLRQLGQQLGYPFARNPAGRKTPRSAC